MKTQQKAMFSKQEKRHLITTDTVSAVNKLINETNADTFCMIVLAAENTFIEITKFYTTPNSLIAKKNALLTMLELGLV